MAAVERAEAAIQHARATLARALQTANVQNDPLRPALEAQLAFTEAQAEMAVALKDVADRAGRPFTKEQMRALSLAIVDMSDARVLSRVLQANRGLVVGAALAVVLSLCIGIGAGWYVWGGAPALTCGPQQGGTVCYYWKTPATEPPAPSPVGRK